MTNQALVPADIEQRYEVHEWRNGLAILTAAHPEEWEDIPRVVRGFKLLRSSSSTTHMAKLRPRLDGGSGGGCPVVVFGIRRAAYVED
jgi:hypothetical protein